VPEIVSVPAFNSVTWATTPVTSNLATVSLAMMTTSADQDSATLLSLKMVHLYAKTRNRMGKTVMIIWNASAIFALPIRAPARPQWQERVPLEPSASVVFARVKPTGASPVSPLPVAAARAIASAGRDSTVTVVMKDTPIPARSWNDWGVIVTMIVPVYREGATSFHVPGDCVVPRHVFQLRAVRAITVWMTLTVNPIAAVVLAVVVPAVTQPR